MSTSMSELKTKGFITLPYPAELHTAVIAAVESWKELCAEPPGIKEMVSGYESKHGIGHKMDRKEKVDVRYMAAADIESVKNRTVQTFLQSATSLFAVLKPTVTKFAQELETASGSKLEGFVDEVAESVYQSSIRFVNYPGNRGLGEEIAWAHADQSGFTLHLYESAPGLQCLTFGREWIDMPVSDGETVIIPGMQMQLRSRSVFKALCHRVVATSETAQDGRYSAVCFVPLSATPKFDGDRAGRLQEKVPGFNYDLPHAEFSKLFK